MSHTRPLLGFLWLLTTAACGARSSLPVSDGDMIGAGRGGASPTSTSSTGGVGGGSPPFACNGVKVASPILSLDEAGGDVSQPNLVVLSTTPPTAAVVYAREVPSQPPLPPVRFGAFAGWGAWPPAAPQITDVQSLQSNGPLSGVTLIATSTTAMSPASFALLYLPGGPSDAFADTGFFLPTVGADGVSSLVQANGWGTALVLAPGGGTDQFLAATVGANGTGSTYVLTPSIAPNVGEFHDTGCAKTPVAADAAAGESGWLLAAALGTKFNWNDDSIVCTQPSFSIALPTALNFATVPPDGHPAVVGQILETATSVLRIRMAPRVGGAWVVWSLDGVAALSAGTVSDAAALVTSFSIPTEVGTLAPLSFAVEPLGDILIVAEVDRMNGSSDRVQITAQDASGTAKWTAAVATEGTVDGPLSLRAAPDGSSLLLAWSELPPGAMTHRVRVARLVCLGS